MLLPWLLYGKEEHNDYTTFQLIVLLIDPIQNGINGVGVVLDSVLLWPSM